MFHFFSGKKYTSMSHGISSVFSYENEEWRSVAAADFEISDYITSEKLTELIFGQFWGAVFFNITAGIKLLWRNIISNWIDQKVAKS